MRGPVPHSPAPLHPTPPHPTPPPDSKHKAFVVMKVLEEWENARIIYTWLKVRAGDGVSQELEKSASAIRFGSIGRRGKS